MIPMGYITGVAGVTGRHQENKAYYLLYTPKCFSIISCYPMLSRIIVCYRMFRMLSYVIVCYCMLSYVIVCYRMLSHVVTYSSYIETSLLTCLNHGTDIRWLTWALTLLWFSAVSTMARSFGKAAAVAAARRELSSNTPRVWVNYNHLIVRPNSGNNWLIRRIIPNWP